MKTTIHNLIILDASGSMNSIKRQAINGFNETVQTIKDAQVKFEDQQHLISLLVFNSSQTRLIYDRVVAFEAKELDDNSYTPDCCTPLYDAIGFSVTRLRTYILEGDKVLVTIITDGEENSSHEYSSIAVKSLINELKESGWLFTYIGANQDVEQVAESIGIHNTMEFQSDVCGTKIMFEVESKSRMNWFKRVSKGESNDSLQENFFD